MLRFALTTIVASLALLFAAPMGASACGGCFAPTGQPSAVTAHRMAVAISQERSVLWDQFQYSGDPEDFVWVLPVTGMQEVQVEIADDEFFQALQNATQVTLQGPNIGGGGGPAIGCGADDVAAGAGAESGGVTVYRQEVVGPYETVVLGSEDGNADTLVDWLQERDYAVPDALRPTIEHYVDQDASFVVLRLAPGEGVRRMQPVRVTWPGMLMTLPLRMIAAGVAGEVALELFVFGEGRYRPGNFADVEVPRDELAYDLATAEYNYDALAAEALQTNDGRAWLTEYAMPSPDIGAIPVYPDASSGSASDGPVYPRDDWEVVKSIVDEPYLTRMRAELPLEALDEDLVLRSSTKEDLGPTIFVEETTDGSAAALPPLSFLALGAWLLMRRRVRA